MTFDSRRPQHAGQRRRRQRLGVEGRHLAGILEPHALDAGLRELAGEQPELLGELDPGPQARRLLGGDVGEVDGVGDGALEQVVGHLLGHLQGDVLLRLGRGRAQVRRADDVGQAEQRAVLGRLDLEHVEGGAGHVARFQRLGQRPLVDQAAARAVDDAHALLGLLQRGGIDDVAGLVGQRRVQGDEIGAAQQVVELDLLHAQLHRPLRRQERIVGDHLHLQADGAVGDDRADVAAADHAQRLGGELDAQELGLLPLAGLRGAVGLRDLAGERHHQRERVLGGGDGIAEGRVHDDDALGGGGLDVDVVDADAGAADHLELGRQRRSPSRSPWWPSARRGRRSRSMIFSSSSLDSPTFTSVSRPRSLKMATAAGES